MLRLYLSLAALVGFAIAQQPLGFVSPSVSATGSQQVQYVVGDEVAVEWTSPFEYTTLEVWQGPKDDGTWVVNTLAANMSQSESTLSWRATQLNGSSEDTGLHFRLQKGGQPNLCATCMANSPSFNLSYPISEQVGGNSTTSTVASGTSPEAHSGSSSRDLAIGLGVGLSTGVVFVIAVILVCLAKRRRTRKDAVLLEAALVDEEKLRYSSGTDSNRTDWSGKSTSSWFDPFEFEEEDGSVKEGWESLFGRDGIPQKLPQRPPAARLG